MNRIILIAFLALAIPQITFAAWWNPISWFSRKQINISTTTEAQKITRPFEFDEVKKSTTTEKTVKTPSISNKGATVSKYPLLVASIHAFLAQPNLQALTEVCKQAKSVPTGNTKDALSADRLTIQKVPLTFYDDFINICGLLENKDIKAVNALPSAFVFDFSADDKDEVRMAKIQSNSNMSIKNRYAQFYVYTNQENINRFIDPSDLSLRCPTQEERNPKIQQTDSSIVIKPKNTLGDISFTVHAPTLFILSILNDMTRPKTIGIELDSREKELQDNIDKMDLGYSSSFSLSRICF